MFLAGASVLQGGTWLEGHGVLLEGNLIRAVLPDAAAPGGPRQHLPPGSKLAPGLIDIQVNGGGGVLFNDAPTAEAARTIAVAHRRLGTTAILPTLITSGREIFFRAAEAAQAGPGILGLHFEGPFLSPLRPGVHRPELIRQPDDDDLAFLEAIRGLVVLTLAPEMVDDAVLRRLHAAGIILCAGHSAASYERMQSAIAAGVTGFTHVFNAMPPASAREPGIVGAALSGDKGWGKNTWCGVIADGIHVHPAMLRLLLAARSAERIMLVSDAMAPTGSDMQTFELQGRTIHRRDGRLVDEEGTLAGADICLMEAVRRVIRLAGVSEAQAMAMASAVPAAFLGLGHRLGLIAPGYEADLVLLDAQLDVLGTWLGGNWEGEAVWA